MKEVLECSVCGKAVSHREAAEHDGEVLCLDCLEERTAVCAECGQRFWRRDMREENGIIVCDSCYDMCYTHCEDCGCLLHDDDVYHYEWSDAAYCEECFEEKNGNTIRNYAYKPEPIFYGSGNLFIGVELEIDKGGEIRENAEEISDIANRDAEHLYCKHDGSLNRGFEIVSHPMTPEYHTNAMPWEEVLQKALALGYYSHQTNTCGLHMHVGRVAFGETYEEQEAAIARVVYFIENHWQEMVRFSRRTEASLNQWASRYGILENTENTYKQAKDSHLGRYVAINLENADTIEFRIFRGTLRHSTFLASLQIVNEICRLAIALDDESMEGLSWYDFVHGIENKPELVAYLKEKNLYPEEKEGA